MIRALELVPGFLPVLLLLLGLRLMDSFKLVPGRATLRSLAWGGAAALAAYGVNRVMLDGVSLDPGQLRRIVAPVIEETLKALPLLWLLRRDAIGFSVDAAIHGFAIGTGFAVVENLYYAWATGSSGLMLWIVRGAGTAVMHGSCTAVVGIVSHDLAERRGRAGAGTMLPGLAIAILAHATFNHLTMRPLVSTAVLLTAFPLLLLVVFERSERATRAWLDRGIESEVETLEQVLGGEIHDTRIGHYLDELRSRFPGAVVADMLCLVQIHLELALKAKGVLMARSAGVELPPDDHLRPKLEELRYLERAIGSTGRMAILPLVRGSGRDLWQRTLLERR